MRKLCLAMAMTGMLATGLAQAQSTLRIGLQDDPDVLDPARARTFVGRIVFASLCDRLVDITPDLKFVPQLAQSWSVGPDNKTLTFKLRTEAVFHDGTPIKAADVTIGSAYHVIPEGLNDLHEGKLNEKAKSVVLLMRLNPEDLHVSPGRENWGYNGIVAYSKICTHVGCPVGLYEQQTHHLLCPCHQSTFDLTHECEVIFGPASRPLPQLPIEVDADGYLVATSDFHEPVGPSYWEREYS